MRKLLSLAMLLAILLSLWPVNLTVAEETSTAPEMGSITVHKFKDSNRNGAQDPGEENLEGWLFRLYLLDKGIHQVAEGATGPDGRVTFTEVPPGRYKVWEELPPCWDPTTPGTRWKDGYFALLDLGNGQQAALEFGNADTCTAPPPPPPETCINLEKTGPTTAEPGAEITYHFRVENCGDVILAGGAQVYDPLFGDAPIWNGDLKPQGVVEFDMAYTLPGDHCGNFTNNAWAVGHPPGYPEVRDDDSWTVEVICKPEPNPSIEVEKYVSVDGQATWEDADSPPGPQVSEGGQVYFRFVVTNNGNVPLTNISLSDSDFDVSGCALSDPLAPTASSECVLGPFNDFSGQHTNTATATGDYDGQTYTDHDDANVTIVDVPSSIEVTKTADPTQLTEPGGEVAFTVRVDNTSAVDSVTLDSLTDSVYGDLNGQGSCAVPQTIPAGGYYECSFSATISGNAGDSETDVVTASATDDDGSPLSDSDDATVTIVDVPSSIEVTKTADPTQLAEPGGEVAFTVRVDNTSAVDSLTLDSLTDSVYGDLDGQGDCAVPQTIAAGGYYACSFSATVSGNAGDSETDIVTATATDDDGNPLSDSDDATVTIVDTPSSIEVTKTADPTELPEPGGEVVFTVRVDNTSAVDSVTLDSLIDSVYGDLNGQGDCAVPQTIPAGGYYACSFSATVLGNAGDIETDVVTAAATDDDGNPLSDSDDATVTIVDDPSSIEVTKTADPTELPEPGGDVVFTVRVDNTSAVDSLTLDSLTDSVYGDLNGQGDCAVPQTIPAGGYYACSFNATVSGNAGDSETDVVTATATDDDGNPLSDSDDATVTIVGEEWDKSSLYFDGDCEGDCEEIQATVCNGDDSGDMAGSTTWELYWIASGNPKNGTVIASGTINPLAADECQVLTYDPGENPNGASGNYMFKAYQRPGHPGTGELWSEACELECNAPEDVDDDSIPDESDNCPAIPNSDQTDSDGDGIGDVCDTCPADPDNDADGDGICGDVDNCPAISNPDQTDSDGDGIGDTCDTCPADPDNDADGDGVCGDVDNCPAISNPDQTDSDGDGIGDTCDTCPADPDNDADGDGVCGDVDNCPATPNPDQADSDGDGIGDACDVAEPCLRLTKTINGPYRSLDSLFLTDRVIPVAVRQSLNSFDQSPFYFLLEITVENCGGTPLTGVTVEDSFSPEAQPFWVSDVENVILEYFTLGIFYHENITWSAGTIPTGESRTLWVRVGTEIFLDWIEPIEAPQTIFYNGRDNSPYSATVTADGGLSAAVGPMAIRNGEEMTCAGSVGEWDNLTGRRWWWFGWHTEPHDRCSAITTPLPMTASASSDLGATSAAIEAPTVEAVQETAGSALPENAAPAPATHVAAVVDQVWYALGMLGQ